MLTRFEKSRVLGARALQLAMGAPVLLKLIASLKDPYEIAEKELEEKVLPLTVIRYLPNGKEVQVDLEE